MTSLALLAFLAFAGAGKEFSSSPLEHLFSPFSHQIERSPLPLQLREKREKRENLGTRPMPEGVGYHPEAHLDRHPRRSHAHKPSKVAIRGTFASYGGRDL